MLLKSDKWSDIIVLFTRQKRRQRVTIDEHVGVIEDLKSTMSVCLPEPEKTEICTSLSEAIDIMRKYQKIEQIKNDALYDIYMASVNMTGEYHGCWVRFKDIENIVNGHFRKVLEDGND